MPRSSVMGSNWERPDIVRTEPAAPPWRHAMTSVGGSSAVTWLTPAAQATPQRIRTVEFVEGSKRVG